MTAPAVAQRVTGCSVSPVTGVVVVVALAVAGLVMAEANVAPSVAGSPVSVGALAAVSSNWLSQPLPDGAALTALRVVSRTLASSVAPSRRAQSGKAARL